jgi:phytoene dehydrogenase-like protein
VPDAVVIGAGPNGLVGANVLADAGWSVVVLEEQEEPGGGVRSGSYLGPGRVADFCSAFYPFAIASPAITALRLEEYGLRWSHAPAVLAHPMIDGECAVLSRDLDATAASLEGFAAGDGAAWQRLFRLWEDVGDDLIEAIFTPFPPIGAATRLARKLKAAGGLRFARMALTPVRRFGEEEFHGPGGPLLLAGSALHADLTPETTASTAFGWLLTMLGQQHGFPVPEGGAGALTAALVRRLTAHGGEVRCGTAVRQVLVRSGRAVAVRTAEGEEIPAERAVLADVVAPHLYRDLVGWDHLPSRMQDDLRRFQWDFGTVKVDWVVRGGIPWTATAARSAGTVHLAGHLDSMTQFAADIAKRQVPGEPFVLLGQMTTSDASRSPAGEEIVWGYTHVPRGVRDDPSGIRGAWDERDRDIMADRMEERIERFAPGFRERIETRAITGPPQFQEHNSNMVGGAINGGTMQPHQQLVFRPVPGLGRPQTPVVGLYLASASAHPGGGVHGACGANAARAALREGKPTRRVLATVARAAKRHGPLDGKA